MIQQRSIFKVTITIVVMVLLLGYYNATSVTASISGPPASGIKLKIANYAYSSKVVNVATDGVPTVGHNITLFAPGNNGVGNSTQWWKNVSLGLDDYMIVLWNYNSIGLNYNQATTKCTLFYADIQNNDMMDFMVEWYSANILYSEIRLAYRTTRFLGTSGNYDGAQLYWYLSQTNEEKWVTSSW